MKRKVKRFLSFIIAMLLVITLFPYHNVEGAQKETTIKTINVDSIKAKSSTSYKKFVDRAVTDKYVMELRENDQEQIMLQVTKDGDAYQKIDIEAIAKDGLEKEGLKVKNTVSLNFFQITSFDNTVCITGNIPYGSEKDNFLIITKDGESFTLIRMPSSLSAYSLGYIYKIGSKYVYTAKVGDEMGGKLGGNTAGYWVSKDLKNWEELETPSNKKSNALGAMWRLEGVTDKGILISALNDDIVPYQFYYSDDLKKFNKVNASIQYDDINANMRSVLENTAVMRREVVFKNNKMSAIKFLFTKDLKSWDKVLSYNPNQYSSNTLYTNYFGTAGNVTILFEREKGNSLFKYSLKNNSVQEYNTSIKSTLVGSGVIDDKYMYLVYDKKYILVSKDNFITSYKIKTPLNNIDKMTPFGNKLLLHGNSNYFISIKDIDKVIATSK